MSMYIHEFSYKQLQIQILYIGMNSKILDHMQMQTMYCKNWEHYQQSRFTLSSFAGESIVYG